MNNLHQTEKGQKSPSPAATESLQAFHAFTDYLASVSGIVIGDHQRYLVKSRLGKLLKQEGLDSLQTLLNTIKLPGERKLRSRVVDAMTTNETSWFRDNSPYEALSKIIFPDLHSTGTRSIRIWSAASSYGQEAYSISITAHEYCVRNPGHFGSYSILGTDISDRAVKLAKHGLYDAISMNRGLSEIKKKQHFIAQGEHWSIKPCYQKPVSFKTLNLLDNFTLLGKFDVIFCRNVLIYFSLDTKRQILKRMAHQLNPGGYLILGSTESLPGLSELFQRVQTTPGVAYKLKSAESGKI